MPSRYVVREFAENCYYHIFNRGVEKRNIFLDNQDYTIFLYYLFVYLTPLGEVLTKYPQLFTRLQVKNLSTEIELISYCLMPNHFHLLLRQKSRDAISKLMKQLTNAYTFYFNQKYKRVGGLVQGRFKSVIVLTDELLVHISRYIHLNPMVAGLVENLETYQWSSYLDYTAKPSRLTCAKDVILSYFPSVNAHEEFVLNQVDYGKNLEKIKHLSVE